MVVTFKLPSNTPIWRKYEIPTVVFIIPKAGNPKNLVTYLHIYDIPKFQFLPDQY